LTKGIEAADQVRKIIYNFEGSDVQSWIYVEEARLVTLTFTEFIMEIKKKFLPTSWEDKLVDKQIGLQGEDNFLTWVMKVRNANAELQAAQSGCHIANDKLCAHFIPRLSTALKLAYKTKCKELDTVKDLNEWIEQVQLLDNKCCKMRASWLKMVMAQPKTSRKNGNIGMTRPMMRGGNNNKTASSSSVIPRLTDDKRKLLDEHQGCYKCCSFYAGHFARDCTCERPSLDACKNVTVANATKAKAAFERKKSTMVAAVFNVDGCDSDLEGFGMGKNDKYVPSSEFPSHLWWSCYVDAANGCSSSPIETLIDHGCPQ
jgi:hypothetical protein